MWKPDHQRGISLYQDNASSHTSAHTIMVLSTQKIKLVGHPPYSPNLLPKDIYSCFSMPFENIKQLVLEISTSEWQKWFKIGSRRLFRKSIKSFLFEFYVLWFLGAQHKIFVSPNLHSNIRRAQFAKSTIHCWGKPVLSVTSCKYFRAKSANNAQSNDAFNAVCFLLFLFVDAASVLSFLVQIVNDDDDDTKNDYDFCCVILFSALHFQWKRVV